jgi:uncharacterized protein YecE (DUF72 family)
MTETAGRIRYGTSSWSEASWDGVFYPAGTAPADRLRHYATQFDAVEVDATYYAIPSPRTVEGWAERTPSGFTIAAKVPGSITHCGKDHRPDASRVLVPDCVGADLERFLDVMRRLGERRGPLLLQFPYFNRDAFAGPHEFLARLDRCLAALPDDFRYAVELRNKQWLGPALLDILRRHRVALALVDLNYLPHADELTFDPSTTDFAYVRLIGDRKAIDAITDRFDRIVVDQRPRLERWARVLQALRARTPEIFAFANNHYAGHAPETIRSLAAIVASAAPA